MCTDAVLLCSRVHGTADGPIRASGGFRRAEVASK